MFGGEIKSQTSLPYQARLCPISKYQKWGKNEENIFKRFESFNKKISKSRGFWV